MQILIIDNYDSFTYNLFQLAADVAGVCPIVVSNNCDWDKVSRLHFDAVIISPGPGRPDRPADFGISADAIQRLDKPLFGVCLGHQGICHFYGGTVIHAPEPMHGRLSEVYHQDTGIFAGLPNPFSVVRYHSLICSEPLPEVLERTAWTQEGLLMGLAHRSLPIWGVQFHPESICTEHGHAMLENFCRLAEKHLSGLSRSPRAQCKPSRRRERAAETDGKPYQVFVRRFPLALGSAHVFEALYLEKSHAFWLDSSLNGDGRARFSFMGGYSEDSPEIVRYSAHEQRLSVQHGSRREAVEEDLFHYLKRRLNETEVACPDLPFDFACGYVGYFGYELKAICGARAAHPSQHPDCLLIFADRCLAIDHETGEVYLLFLGSPEESAEAAAWFDTISAQLADLPAGPATARRQVDILFAPAHTQESYLAKIDQCMTALADGESYEICLTNQLCAEASIDPFSFYRLLRERNPAPYSAFLKFPELAVACSSPERFLKISQDGIVEAKPIKGTIKRGADAQEDQSLRERLASDPKSRSENLMIVDLLRNDLGRVCEVGSVTVPKLMHVETYATLHQLVSTITGRLRADQTAVDCLRAAFPGGSMTGAPKIRTMEIIDDLEGRARGIYSGAIGFLSLNGAADLNIVIRTAVFAAETVSIGVGGAIVALSDPVEEWHEILLKSRALVSAFQEITRGTTRG
jgi:para-aminobenzoate synthetase